MTFFVGEFLTLGRCGNTLTSVYVKYGLYTFCIVIDLRPNVGGHVSQFCYLCAGKYNVNLIYGILKSAYVVEH